MRRLYLPQVERAESLIPHFSASTARALEELPDYSITCWACELNVPSHGAVYVGRQPTEALSFLVWREVEVCGVAYKEAVAQLTESPHGGRGYAKIVLRNAATHCRPMFSDREGITCRAFNLWYRMAKNAGGIVLDLTTGKVLPLAKFTEAKLWNEEVDCERYQILFPEA